MINEGKIKINLPCPYGQVGDYLWVRETYQYYDPRNTVSDPRVYYKSDYSLNPTIMHWRPSIHMPRWASRINLEITNIRVQRLQEITEQDAESEGVKSSSLDGGQTELYKLNFVELWDSINVKRGYDWQSNPFVWAITFKQLDSKER